MSYYIINNGRAYGVETLEMASLIQECLQSVGEASEIVFGQ